MNGECNSKCFWPRPWGPGKGSKVKYHLISITKLILKIFIPNSVCVLTNERYKPYQVGFLFCCLDHAQEVGLKGAGMPRGGQKKFKHGHVAYQMDGDDEQNRMQVKFPLEGQTGNLGMRSKGQISSKLGYHIYFKDFYTKLCACSYK